MLTLVSAEHDERLWHELSTDLVEHGLEQQPLLRRAETRGRAGGEDDYGELRNGPGLIRLELHALDLDPLRRRSRRVVRVAELPISSMTSSPSLTFPRTA